MTLRTFIVKLGFKGDISKLVDFDKKVSGLKTNILGLTAIFAGATAALGYFLNEAAKLEQTKIAFEVMTNSVQLGQKLIKDLFRFARTTPFQIPGVLQASKILLAMGITAEEQIPVLTSLGHVAAGIGKPLDQLASIFGRVRAAGYLTGYEMERLRRAGVPLGAYLSEMLKKPEREILKMIRRKEISYEIFQQGWEMMVEKRFPRLMDRLLTTFKGIVSNLKDYVYEIVAFSGEELLPIAKLMANQLMYLLDSSRELIGLKFKQFFGGVSAAARLLNKLFVRMYFRTKEISAQLGGFNRLFKIFAGILGTVVGLKSLALLGKIGKIAFTAFSIANLKLALLGASMLMILGITEDIFGFLSGKESRIEKWLDWLEDKFPIAFRHIKHWLIILKREIEGFSLLLVGLFEGMATGDWTMAKEGLKQISEAYKMMTGGVKEKIKTEQFDPFVDVDVEGMNFIEGTIAQSKLLKDVAQKFEEWKDAVDKWPEKFAEKRKGAQREVDEFFFPGGVPEVQAGVGVLGKLFSGTGDRPILPTPSEYSFPQLHDTPQSQAIDKMWEAFIKSSEQPANVTINNNVNVKELPKNANSKEVAEALGKTIEPIVRKTLDKTLTEEFSAVERKTK